MNSLLESIFSELKWLVTFGVALAGLILSLINLWRAIDRDKVKLRFAICGVAMAPGGPFVETVAITVTNLSVFPVGINEVGFTLKRTLFAKGKKLFVLPMNVDGTSSPRRIKQRESITLFISPQALPKIQEHSVSRSYVRTDCGEQHHGSGRHLSYLIAGIMRRAEESLKR